MVLDRGKCTKTAPSAALVRSRSSRTFSPQSIRTDLPGKHDDQKGDGGSRVIITSWSPSRRRSQSQNQIRKTLDDSKSTARVHDNPRASCPLRLRKLPLSFMGRSFTIDDKASTHASAMNHSSPTSWRDSPQSRYASPSPPKHLDRHYQVHLAPLKRVSVTHGLDLHALGNQEDINEVSVAKAGVSDDAEPLNCDNQRDDQTPTVMGSNCCEHKSGVASPRRTYLPRLATLDLTGDSRYFLHHPSSLESPNAIITDDDARNEQVERICDEIYMTECAYVSDLKTLLHHFFEPLQDYAIKHTIDLGAMTALHSSIKIILHIHKELLRQLLTLSDSNNEVSSYSDEEIVSVDEQLLSPPVSISSLPRYVAAFDFTIEFMKVYAFYCSSYLSAKDELALLQKKYPGLGTLTTQLNEHARDELHVDILAHMIKPVQRICQYPIFFRELLKNVVTEQDAANVEHTLHKIESVAMHVNEKVREAQQNARLFELHQTIDSKSAKVDLLQPSRTLLSEAVVRVVILDLPRWPSFFSKLRFRRRRSDEAVTSRRASRQNSADFLTALCPQSARLNDARLPSDASPESTASTSSSSSSFISLSPSSQAPPLLRRRSSGDKVRLILLSDALLMAKKHEEKLKVQRQLCLSCASVQDCKDDPNAPKCSFMMEVSKVGRCQCHQLAPATLKRSPKWRNSLSMITGSTTSTMTPQPRSKAPRKASGFEFASFRSTKQYVVICDSEPQKYELLRTLQRAIAKCARGPSMTSLMNFGAKAEPAMGETNKEHGATFWRSMFKQQSWSFSPRHAETAAVSGSRAATFSTMSSSTSVDELV